MRPARTEAIVTTCSRCGASVEVDPVYVEPTVPGQDDTLNARPRS
jgi:hypothetical protein